jgi:hypothetical protein
MEERAGSTSEAGVRKASEAFPRRRTWPLQVHFSTKSKDRNTMLQQRQLNTCLHSLDYIVPLKYSRTLIEPGSFYSKLRNQFQAFFFFFFLSSVTTQ